MSLTTGRTLTNLFDMLFGCQGTLCGEKIMVSNKEKAENLSKCIRRALDDKTAGWEDVVKKHLNSLNILFEDWAEVGLEEDKFYIKYFNIALVETPIRPIYYADIVYRQLEDGRVLLLKDTREASAILGVHNSDGE